MALTTRTQESILKVKEEVDGREQVAEGKVCGGDRPEKETLSFSTDLWEILSGLLFPCLKGVFPLQVSCGQAALITCLMGLLSLRPLWTALRGAVVSPPAECS